MTPTAPQPFTQVDAFADRPFAGNPAAVCVLPLCGQEAPALSGALLH
jgi:predicted PhzF superfamily epimerase YddE/YHI9